MHPYSNLPPKAFWKPADRERNRLEIEELWDPKFRISPKDKVSTYGSCFAQNIGRALRERGFTWYQAEPAPNHLGSADVARFNYDVFSSQTADIPTTSLLLQWAEWAFGVKPVPREVWEVSGRFIDPFRAPIEPDGFASVEELRRSREETLRAFRQSIVDASVLVFTLGSTERWSNTDHGYEYPTCPGTAGGTFDSNIHAFDNMSFHDVIEPLRNALKIFRSANPKLRVILTVSPVPVVATMSGKHVSVATMQSKSVLRAVAGHMADRNKHIDYFPAYEIINSPVFRGNFFELSQRGVTAAGMKFVIDTFFRGLERKFGSMQSAASGRSRPGGGFDLQSSGAIKTDRTARPKFFGYASRLILTREIVRSFHPTSNNSYMSKGYGHLRMTGFFWGLLGNILRRPTPVTVGDPAIAEIPTLSRGVTEASWSVVATVRAPQWMVDQFVRYYIQAGANEIFLFFDDPEVATVSPHPRLEAIVCDEAYWRGSRPEVIEGRQHRNHARARAKSKATWLLHVDIDELIYADRPVAEVLAKVPPDVFSVVAPSREAVYEALPSPQTMFRTKYFKNPEKADGAVEKELFEPPLLRFGKEGIWGHTRGKTFVRNGARIARKSLHRPESGVAGLLANYDTGKLVLLHFEGMTFDLFREKYMRRSTGAVKLAFCQTGRMNDRRMYIWEAYQSGGERRLLEIYKKMHVLGPGALRRGLDEGYIEQHVVWKD